MIWTWRPSQTAADSVVEVRDGLVRLEPAGRIEVEALDEPRRAGAQLRAAGPPSP